MVSSCKIAVEGKKSDTHVIGNMVILSLLLDRRSRAMHS